ncbi:hypothetical protein, partial [Chloroflexus sp.]|uniref:hypothetical protein n=1 Tax=Chloroflexus sp. TaxID=1904827 RepID=UPI004049B6B1
MVRVPDNSSAALLVELHLIVQPLDCFVQNQQSEGKLIVWNILIGAETSVKRSDISIKNCGLPPFIGLLTVIERCGTPVLSAWTGRSGVNVGGCAVRCLRRRRLEATENVTTVKVSGVG